MIQIWIHEGSKGCCIGALKFRFNKDFQECMNSTEAHLKHALLVNSYSPEHNQMVLIEHDWKYREIPNS